MIKFIKTLVFVVFMTSSAFANNNYLEDVKNFGYVAGEGLACGASRYPSYELVARAFLVSSARSDSEQAKGMYEYNNAKATAYINKRSDGLLNCSEINSRFDNQKIFNAKLYKNGTLKMPDGKVIKPRQKYNPNYLYNRSENEREKLNVFYNKIIAKRQKQAQKEGIYQKIRSQESRR